MELRHAWRGSGSKTCTWVQLPSHTVPGDSGAAQETRAGRSLHAPLCREMRTGRRVGASRHPWLRAPIEMPTGILTRRDAHREVGARGLPRGPVHGVLHAAGSAWGGGSMEMADARRCVQRAEHREDDPCTQLCAERRMHGDARAQLLVRSYAWGAGATRDLRGDPHKTRGPCLHHSSSSFSFGFCFSLFFFVLTSTL
jgi:hypothetical protein